MTPIRRSFDFMTRHFWAIILVFLLNGVALVVLLGAEARFTVLTGLPVFDTQNELTHTQVLEQLPLYEGMARQAYWQFMAFDFVFPLVGGAFFTLLYAFFLRRLPWAWAGWLWSKHLYFVALLMTMFDYLENVGFASTLLSGTPPSAAAIQFALLCKHIKLFSLSVGNVVAGFLLLAFIVAWVMQRQFPKPISAR